MRRSITFMCTLGAAILLLSGCNSSTPSTSINSATSNTSNASSSNNSDSSKIEVVASTNVWGSIASEIGGKNVKVTSLINSPTQDPHDYEASAQDKLAIKNAGLIIVNGGEYDYSIEKIAKETMKDGTKFIDAVKVSGLYSSKNPNPNSSDPNFNEHVFYNLNTAKKMADTIAKDLGEIDKNNQNIFLTNAKAFNEKMDKILSKAREVGAGHELTALATEPVTGYLLENMQIKNVTPEQFVEQSESDAGPSAKLLEQAVKLLNSRTAKLLVLNAQTEDSVSNKLLTAANQANPAVPVVKVFETFSAGVTDYETFISQTIAAFAKAAGSNK